MAPLEPHVVIKQPYGARRMAAEHLVRVRGVGEGRAVRLSREEVWTRSTWEVARSADVHR